jgi:choline kinase
MASASVTRAILLAAGRGLRLHTDVPKCLLSFEGKSLLERHLRMLRAHGVQEIVVAVGFRRDLVEAELDRLGFHPRPQLIANRQFELGSLLTVHTVVEPLTRGGDTLLMDADVLYDDRIMTALLAGRAPVSRALIDREFEPGDEPVKLCLRDGVPVEFSKRIASGLTYDTVGESVGFFRLDERAARRLATITAGYVERGQPHLPHEEAVRDLLLEGSQVFDVADVTGAPWIEIDFPEDVSRATRDVLPHLRVLAEAVS